MKARRESGLLGWVKSQMSTLRRRRSSSSQQKRRSRALIVESLENRELLTVTVLTDTLTWKQFDYTGTGALSGSFHSTKMPAGINGSLSGSANVAGSILYTSATTGAGSGTVNGQVTASVPTVPSKTIPLITPAGTTGAVSDTNGALSIEVPGQKSPSGGPLVMTGTFKTSDFSVSVTGAIAVADGTTNGAPGTITWKGKILPGTDPLTVTVSPKWDEAKLGTVDLAIQVGGAVQKAATRTTAVATVSFAWADATGRQLTALKDKIPILWNQAGGNYELSALPTPPATATQLLITSTIGRAATKTSLALSALAKPTLAISDASVTPAATGTTPMVFTVTLTGPTAFPVTVSYATATDTTPGATAASSGTDYTTKKGTLTFQPGGPTTLTIAISVKRDKTIDNETFFVNLLPTNLATFGDSQAVGSIIVVPVGA